MKFIWDESKRISNIKKHGLDFALTYLVFKNDTFTFEDNRIVYNERRFITLGLLDSTVVVVVHTETDNEIRVISLRKAVKNEQELYFTHV
jgi:uncharacterized DUF497 family protein